MATWMTASRDREEAIELTLARNRGVEACRAIEGKGRISSWVGGRA